MEKQMRVVNIDRYKLWAILVHLAIITEDHVLLYKKIGKLKNKLIERVRKWKSFWNDYSRISGF
jgi:hypothetical protein